MWYQSARAISQQKPASSRAIATATTPLGLRRACLSCCLASVEPSLGAPGDVDDVRGLALLATLELFARGGMALIMVGGLDQEPAGVRGAGFGDRALPALLPWM